VLPCAVCSFRSRRDLGVINKETSDAAAQLRQAPAGSSTARSQGVVRPAPISWRTQSRGHPCPASGFQSRHGLAASIRLSTVRGGQAMPKCGAVGLLEQMRSNAGSPRQPTPSRCPLLLFRRSCSSEKQQLHREGPEVRIRVPPAESLQTFGSSHAATADKCLCTPNRAQRFPTTHSRSPTATRTIVCSQPGD
jgi:hypothetical protein